MSDLLRIAEDVLTDHAPTTCDQLDTFVMDGDRDHALALWLGAGERSEFHAAVRAIERRYEEAE